MSDDEIIELAKDFAIEGEMIGFARAIEAKEREACAKLCEEKKSRYDQRSNSEPITIDREVARIAMMTCDFIAHDIRARGE